MSFLEKTRESCRQSDEHWNRFKGDTGENSETVWSAYGLFRAHRYHPELNKMDTNRNVSFLPFATVPIVCSWFHQRWRDMRP